MADSTPPAAEYLLPSSPLTLREDRFSLTDSEDDLVPFFEILKAILDGPVNNADELVERLETITITGTSTLRVSSRKDWTGLRDFLLQRGDHFVHDIYPKVIELALEMPDLFPSGAIPILTPTQPGLSFSRRQIACLVAHQFLCTLEAPSWMAEGGSSPDFSIWYGAAEDQPHPKAVQAYLTILIAYLERVTLEPNWLDDDQQIIITLRNLSVDQLPFSLALSTSFSPIDLISIPDATTHPPIHDALAITCVISANKYIGFGQTGTQEEVQFGCAPELCPIVLFTPLLRDNEVVIVEGVRQIAVIEGYGRRAHLSHILPSRSSPPSTMLFMDALELDGFDAELAVVPDLLPGYIRRELGKAYTAFSSGSPPYPAILTGLWGCGAFGGNAQIKTLLQWCAASYAGSPLKVVIQEDRAAFLRQFQAFGEVVRSKGWSVENVLRTLEGIRADDPYAKKALLHIEQTLSK